MKSGMGKLLTFIMAAFLLVFAGYHAYRHFFSDYTTENVYRYTVYHLSLIHIWHPDGSQHAGGGLQ